MSTKGIAIAGAVILALLIVPVFLAGNKVTMSNYNKVQMGMNYSQVSKILGKGTPIEEKMEGQMPTMPQNFQLPANAHLPPGMDMPDMSQTNDMLQKMMSLEVYIWEKEEDKVGIAIGLIDDRVVMKSQQGLAAKPSFEMEGMDAFGIPLP